MMTCICGSRKFKTSITLELVGVPVRLLKNGTMNYDDTKADYSDGWDVLQQPEVACAKCGHLYDLEEKPKGDKNTDSARYELVDKEE